MSKTNFYQMTPEVMYSDGNFLAVEQSTVELLRSMAREAPRRRSRLCFHANPEAVQQEMLIVMHRSSYVRPHRHHGKVETLAVVEGYCDAILFDTDGSVDAVVPMSAPGGGDSFFYRMPEGVFHTLLLKSEWLVFLETTIGPFDRKMTEEAKWAPTEKEASAGHAYLNSLSVPSS